MNLNLENKVAIITGGSKGITLSLADEGCSLVLCARGEELFEKTTKEIRKKL